MEALRKAGLARAALLAATTRSPVLPPSSSALGGQHTFQGISGGFGFRGLVSHDPIIARPGSGPHQPSAQIVQLLEAGITDSQLALAAAIHQLNLQAEGVGQILLQ